MPELNQTTLLEHVDRCLSDIAAEAPHPINEMTLHLLEAGGKRLRPQIVFFASKLGTQPPQGLVEIATAAELVHSSSLLHDDVIDEAPLRRGQPAPRMVWGNAYSVLAGDHLMASALLILGDVEIPGLLSSMLKTLKKLVTAELIQIEHRGKLLGDVDLYYEVVHGKTASLFAWCAESGARAAQADPAISRALATYGEEIGIAFQLVDDLLDLSGAPEELGKSLFSDISQGIATLPVILASRRRPELTEKLLELSLSGDHQALRELTSDLRKWVEETGAIEETKRRAREHVEKALQPLDALKRSPERSYLVHIAESMIERTH